MNRRTGKPQERVYRFRATQQSDGTTTIAGYASVFGNRNSYGEVFVPGAYTDTLDRDADHPLIMGYMHREAIGKWDEYREDPESGLFLKGPISKTRQGEDAAVLVRDEVLTGLSIGFYPIDEVFASGGERVTFETPYGPRSFQNDEPTFYVLKADLVEASIVMAPSDDKARLTGVEVRDAMQRAEKALPALRTDAWEDAAYSMALLMGGRGAAMFADLPPLEHRALFDRVVQAYERHGKEAPDYTRFPQYDEIDFRHDEREVFHDRYLRKNLDAVIAGANGVRGALSEDTTAKAREAIAALSPHTRDVAAEIRRLAADVTDTANQFDTKE